MKQGYDVIIIGAGIGGLVCGCYLARGGCRVLIVEKNDKVGGNCCSFKVNGFQFDAGAHTIGNHKECPLSILFEELMLNAESHLIKPQITDWCATDDFVFKFRSNIKEVIDDLRSSFPAQERSITKFFKTIYEPTFFDLSVKLKKLSFKSFLDSFFRDSRIKDILSCFSLNKGLPPQEISALSLIMLFRNYIIGGGVYPLGGMQSFAEMLSDQFKRVGGQILLSQTAQEILIKNNKIYGVKCSGGNALFAPIIVANCDVRNLANHLIGRKFISTRLMHDLNEMQLSPSAFAVHLGLTNRIAKNFRSSTSIWGLRKGKKQHFGKFRNVLKHCDHFLISSPSFHDDNLAPKGKECVTIMAYFPVLEYKFWDKNKEYIAHCLIQNVKSFFPDMLDVIELKVLTTPNTFYEHTLNTSGAAFGWASTARQCFEQRFVQQTIYENLYLCGHWTFSLSGYGGIPQVVYSGRKTAQDILKKFHECVTLY